MPVSKKLIDPTKDAIANWLKNARLGDQCQIMTPHGDVYASLTKLKPGTAELLTTAFGGTENFVSNQNGFMELLEILKDADQHPSGTRNTKQCEPQP